jgi:hypothetical protein
MRVQTLCLVSRSRRRSPRKAGLIAMTTTPQEPGAPDVPGDPVEPNPPSPAEPREDEDDDPTGGPFPE